MIGMIILLLVVSVIGFIYRSWFTALPLTSGDWPYLFIENIKEFSWFPEIRFLWLSPYYQILTKIVVQYVGVPWVITEKVFWFLPFIILSFFASYKLTRSMLGALIYTTNTYALMIVGGGQMGVAMAYAIAPLVLKRFNLQSSIFKSILITGAIFAIQVMFDPRIAILTLVASILYYVFKLREMPPLPMRTSIGIAALLNLYWIVPLLRSQTSIAQQLGEATVDSVKFLSFATFEQTISLLHPNWPENIFGKVHFVQSEFLFLPIIAFSSLFIAKKSRTILYFSFLALLGAFLAKGANEPFGEVYIWLFNHIPGFVLFRDPSKFYLYTALAFSVLIPLVIQRTGKTKLLSLFFILFWLFTIREAFFGQLTGTFRPANVPQEYIKLKDFFNTQYDSFQTLWIPERQRFGFSSKLHPGIDAQLLSKQSSISGMIHWVSNEETQRELMAMQVKYIIVPYDSRGELFLTDRKYDEKLYLDTMDKIFTVPWLHKVDAFFRIGVFEVR